MVSPSTFAVLRLTTNSNFVGCSTGMSPEFLALQDLIGPNGLLTRKLAEKIIKMVDPSRRFLWWRRIVLLV